MNMDDDGQGVLFDDMGTPIFTPIKWSPLVIAPASPPPPPPKGHKLYDKTWKKVLWAVLLLVSQMWPFAIAYYGWKSAANVKRDPDGGSFWFVWWR